MILKKVLGHIDCPSCGTAGGLRITHDKNGHPFGFCEATCNQQIRIGGDARRVAAFVARYPWAAGEKNKEDEPMGQLSKSWAYVPAAKSKPAKIEKAKPAPATKPEAVPVPVPTPVIAPAPAPAAKPRSAFDDALKFLSGAGA